MLLSTKTRYACRAMAELAAAHPDNPVSVKDIARSQRLSPKYLEHIVSALKAAGLIRRIGATFHPDRLGYVSTLVGMQVPGERVECLAAFVGRFPEVTHSYERDGDWNLWFTVVAPSAQRLAAVLDAVREAAPGCQLVSLPAKRRYKVRVEFDLVRLNDGSLADR